MDKSDKNIEKIFSDYDKKYEIDLEESIMDSIHVERNYHSEFSQSKRNIKKGIVLSTAFLIAYFVLTYFDTLPRINQQMKLLNIYLPSIFTAMLILIMYLLFTFSFTSSKSGIDKLFLSKK